MFIDKYSTSYKAIPTEYKGIRFRSKQEAKTANALDNFGIKWVYEKYDYQLSNGLWYKPDFFLPNMKMWIECKAEQYPEAIAKAHCLVLDTEQPVLIMGYDWAKLYKYWYNETPSKAEHDGWFDLGCESPDIVCYEQGCVFIAKCCRCGNWYFTSDDDSYQCTCCDYYDGDSSYCDFFHFSGVTDLFNKGQELAAKRYSIFCK